MKYFGDVKKKRIRNDIFSTLSISYLAIFVLSFVVGIVIISLSQKQARESLYEYNRVVVSKMQESIETIHTDVCEFSRRAGNDDRVIDVVKHARLYNNDYDQWMPVINYINDYRLRNQYIHDIFIHCIDSDAIISSSVHNT